MTASFTNSFGETFNLGDKVYFVRVVSDPFVGMWQEDMTEIANKAITTSEEFTIEAFYASESDRITLCEENEFIWHIDMFSKTKPVKSTPHVHAELIKKWADDPSIEIEYYSVVYDKWCSLKGQVPGWHVETYYRIKSEVKIEKRYQYAYWMPRYCVDEELTRHFSDYFPSDESFKSAHGLAKAWTRLDWTEKEFEVEA
jgi:hypothetical protein